MRKVFFGAFVAGLCVAGLWVLAAKPVAAEELPYSMRSHYTFPMGSVQMQVFEDNAEWRVLRGEEAVAERLGFEIEFADGTVWTNTSLGRAEMTRKPLEHGVLGSATDHTIAFLSREGLLVKQRVIRFRERPYLVFQLGVENMGEEAVTVRRLSPVTAPVGGITAITPTIELRERHLRQHGGSAVFDGAGTPLMAMFVDTANSMHNHIAVLPEGKAASHVSFRKELDAWHGGAHSQFAPPVQIAPGESLASDKVAVYFDASDEGNVLLYYAQIFGTLPRAPRPDNWPKAWTSAPGGDGMSAVLRSFNAWKSAGVRHALIPDDWESRPGSLRTAGNRYPNSLEGAVRQLRDAGAAAGITLEALAVQASEGPGVALSVDGQPWANPASKEGAVLVQQRALALVSAGVAFIVVPPSRIPDEVLESFNISRGEADSAALLLVAQAATGLPVFPAAGTAAGSLSSPHFTATAALAKNLTDNGVALAPVRVNREELVAAASQLPAWPGPIEIWGGESAPARDAVRAYVSGR